MAKKNTIILVIVAVVSVAAGFAVSQVVQASFFSPGSKDDPFVSQSYVETIVGERTAVLQTQIDELQTQLNGGSTKTSDTGEAGATNANNEGNSGEANETVDKTVTITGNSVNVRSEASSSGSVVGKVSSGDKVSLVGQEGDWYKVKLTNGTEGWIASWLGEIN
ncbi:MAG: SH3 domain-containing protein [Bacillota bacterium]|jgi:uncharacterized protein YgiM (DUF1202 family)